MDLLNFKDNMRFVIESSYNTKNYLAFEKYLFRRVRVFVWILAIILLIVGIVLTIFEFKSVSVYFTFPVIMVVAFYVYYHYLSNKLVLSNEYLNKETTQTFEFNEDKVIIKQMVLDKVISEEYDYKSIYMVVRYKEYYFLHINRVQAYIIEDNDFILGDRDSFEDFLKDKFKNKYIKK